jgi:hypothetical protein
MNKRASIDLVHRRLADISAGVTAREAPAPSRHPQALLEPPLGHARESAVHTVLAPICRASEEKQR